MHAGVNIPVLDGLGGGGGPQLGHQDPHDVEEEDEVNLRVRADWGQCQGSRALLDLVFIKERLNINLGFHTCPLDLLITCGDLVI